MERVRFRFGKGFKVAIGNKRSQAAQMVLEPGETEGGNDNHHRGADQWLYVVSGSGVAAVDGKRIPLSPDTLVLIEKARITKFGTQGRRPFRQSIFTFHLLTRKTVKRSRPEIPESPLLNRLRPRVRMARLAHSWEVEAFEKGRIPNRRLLRRRHHPHRRRPRFRS